MSIMMPKAPLTPISSTEIRSKDGPQLTSLQMSFELPPPAVVETRPSTTSTSISTSTKSTPASSYQPASPKSPAIPVSETVKTRRRSSVAQAPAKDVFALPPPPTRSRKIIQMKPRVQNEAEGALDANDTAGKLASLPKKKQPSSTSVAGRKIARKTAHSLIERRRRSKMNEEFGVLKDMIPACTGEMHKLAILQVRRRYLRMHCRQQLLTRNIGFYRLRPLPRRLCHKIANRKLPHKFKLDPHQGEIHAPTCCQSRLIHTSPNTNPR